MAEIDPVTGAEQTRVEQSGPPLSRTPENGAAPPPKKSRAGTFFFGVFSGCLIGLLAMFFIGVAISTSRGETSDLLATQKIAIVPIDGEIFDARDTLEALHRYADSSTIKAIVIRINSPGGAIAASQEIYEEIGKIRRETGKPVVASLQDVAASGAFYIATACDQIVANPGSITGSIGVILQWMEIKDLVAWAKMKPETITSGAMKDVGSPYRDLTESERTYLQQVSTQLHGQFVRAVAAGRRGKITEADVWRVADGRIFTGEEAVGLKLVDRLGNLDDAVRVAAKLAGVRGKPRIVFPRKHKKTLLDLLTNSGDSESLVDRVVSRRAGFLYRW